jgi:CelD/BcsL family acetyltransferase involved in cellulose biosynthesis
MRAQEERTKAEPQPHGQRLDTAVLRDTREFASLEEEWDDLYRHSPRATPFQSWAWLYSWWECYGEDYELRLVAVREGGLLVGLLPLMLERRWGFGRLLLIGGNAMTPYKDVLAREGWEQEVAEAGARALKGLGGWRVADLRELRPEAATWDAYRKWDGPRTSVGMSGYVLIHTKAWENLLMSLSRKSRESARKTLRRAKEDGVRPEMADSEAVEQAARRLEALHRELWRGRPIDPEHLARRYEAFVETAAWRMTARGIGGISEFWRDGKVVASHLLVFDADFVGGCVLGASQEASRRYQFLTLCIWDDMNVARSNGAAYVSLGDGVSREKLRWADEVVPSYRVIMGRGLASWIPYTGYHTLRSEASRYVLSEGAPRWIKTAAEGYDTLRYKGSSIARTLRSLRGVFK